MAVQTTIKLRRDTAANWTSTNPTLAAGEIGFESDTYKLKIGDGSTAWTSLNYKGSGRGLYGDGSDGSATISGTTTLTRDMFYTTLTVQNGGTLIADGNRIFCSVLCQVDAGGKIHNSGTAGAANGTAGTPATRNSIGGTATTTSGAGGTAGGSSATSRGDSRGGSGGNGGSGSGGSGGSGGTASAPGAWLGDLRSVPFCITGSLTYDNGTWTSIQAGMGGGGGGGDGTAGGGGGGAGGALVLVARNLILNGTIEAKGGAGGTPAAGNRGGGGGGGGGVIMLTYNTKTGSGSISAAGGAKGLKSGTGTDGVDGSTGTVIEVTNA